MNNKVLRIIFGVIVIIIGVLIIIIGNNKIKRCNTQTVGTVVDIKVKKEKDEHEDSYVSYKYTYYPVIEFKAGNKVVSQKYSSGYSSENAFRVGDKVDIMYDANKPETFIIKGDKSHNLLAIVFIVAGVSVIIAGVLKKY